MCSEASSLLRASTVAHKQLTHTGLLQENQQQQTFALCCVCSRCDVAFNANIKCSVRLIDPTIAQQFECLMYMEQFQSSFAPLHDCGVCKREAYREESSAKKHTSDGDPRTSDREEGLLPQPGASVAPSRAPGEPFNF